MSKRITIIILVVLTIIISASPFPSILIPLYFIVPTFLIRFKYKTQGNFSFWQNIISVIKMYLSSMLISANLAAQNLEPDPRIKLASRYTYSILIYSCVIGYEYCSGFAADFIIKLASSLLPLLILEFHMQAYNISYQEILIEYPQEMFSKHSKIKK